jgi:hypothetical protein
MFDVYKDREKLGIAYKVQAAKGKTGVDVCRSVSVS